MTSMSQEVDLLESRPLLDCVDGIQNQLIK